MNDLFNKSIDLHGLLEDVKKAAQDAADELRRKDLIDPSTGTKLTRGYHKSQNQEIKERW